MAAMTATVFDVVDAIRRVPGANRDRGTLFEALTAEYLRRDPVFAASFLERVDVDGLARWWGARRRN